MPKKCECCGFFDPENDLTECPNCDSALQFTMFTPPGYETQEQEEDYGGAAPWSEHLANYEEMELPVGIRMAQIGAGIGAYFLVSRGVTRLVSGLFAFGSGPMTFDELLTIQIIFILTFHVVGAIVGGAVAGAWSINWIPQGIGVGIGVFTIPIILFLVFAPAHTGLTILFLAVICFTTMFAVLGAYLGHKVIRPSRYVIS